MEGDRPRDLLDVAYEATASSVAEVLGEEHTAEKAAELAQSAARLLDRLLSRLDREHPPACRAKCSWCCYLRVACSVPEAILVAAYVQTGLTKRVRRELVARIGAVCDQTRDLDASARARLRLPCPFLSDGLCLVHPARPLACRGWHSFDVEQCKRHWRDPSAQIDASGARLSARGNVSRALADGLRRTGLVGDSVELDAAVRLILSKPDTVAAWLRGEDAFAAVRWRG